MTDTTLAELSRLVTEIESPEPSNRTQSYTQESHKSDLADKIEAYKSEQELRLKSYVEEPSTKEGNTLLFLEGFEEMGSALIPSATTGGFFFSWKGFGVAVNPGHRFLERFHAQGHHITAIDAVIVTCDQLSQEVVKIYQLNQQYNLMSENFHLINYYFNPKTHKRLAPLLKPYFKQERNMLVSLDLFLDSESKETVELTRGLQMNYTQAKESLALMFHLSNQKKLGYLSNAPYFEGLNPFFKGADILILGVQKTSSLDVGKIEYNEDSLGYYGVYSLVEAVEPDVVVLSEFSGDVGDIRLDLVKELRQSLPSTYLPVDRGLEINLETLAVKISHQNNWVDKASLKVIQPKGPFSPLHYMSDENIV